MHRLGMSCGGSAFWRVPPLIYTHYQLFNPDAYEMCYAADRPGWGWVTGLGSRLMNQGVGSEEGTPLPWEPTRDLFQVLFPPPHHRGPGRAQGRCAGLLWGLRARGWGLLPASPRRGSAT